LVSMPWLTEQDRRAIYHDNLATLLSPFVERTSQ
jgi:hypothetical protein